MSGLTRDVTAEPYPRVQTLRRKQGQGNLTFPVQLTTSRIGNHTRLMPTLLKVMTTHTYTLLQLLLILLLESNRNRDDEAQGHLASLLSLIHI